MAKSSERLNKSKSGVESKKSGKRQEKPHVAGMSSKQQNNDSVSTTSKEVSTPISILIESLVKNLCTVYEPDAKKSTMMYEFICDKLFKMNLIDESYNMNEFEGMRSQYQRAFIHLLKNAVGGEQPLHLRPVWPSVDKSASHYYREFDEIEYIAGGGFGRVYRVKHKLDGTEYAVKKIPIRSEGIESVRNYLSEVKTFASMNHPNIVQYKAAWLELGSFMQEPTLTDTESESTHESYCTSTKIKEHIDDEFIYHRDEIDSFSDKKDESSDFEVNFEHSYSDNKLIPKQFSNSSNVVFSSNTGISKRTKRNSASEGGLAICTLDFKEIRELQMQQRSHPKWATLYIQMALCQSTLKQWIEKRNNSEISTLPADTNAIVAVKSQPGNDTIYEILKQLLIGIQYIHSKGVVHHDIKPSNIFIQLENGHLLVQLGDFGLACPLQSVRHSLAFGTKLYAAPEQLAGKCDPKSDMYSLGIVLYELVETFHTDMERVQCITNLRKGRLPPHVIIQQPQLAKIITQLVTKFSEDRPDAGSLLKGLAGCPPELREIQELRCQIAEKDEEIARLKELLKAAQVECV